MPLVHLTDRTVIRLTGDDARSFLHNVSTGEILSLVPGQAGFGALLTPQGKIIADFLVVPMQDEDGGGFVLDAPVAVAPQLLQRLAMYRLRAKVAITDQSDSVAVLAGFGDHAQPGEEALAYPDPRAPGLGQRYLVARDDAATLAPEPVEAWLRHRIGLGVPDGGKDFAYGETFPHEALMDQLHGLSFTKGCYVGQEVVSRMQHRGTARSRIVPIRFLDGIRADWGVDVTAGDRPLGKVGSTIGDRGLALIRLDRAQDALAAGEPILAGGLPVEIERAAYARFPMPGDAEFGTVST